MAYNNFPNYQNPYFPNVQYQQAGYQQPAQQNSGIIWVQGEAGAKSYMVAPNNTVQLWDSEAQVIYLKSADSSGMPSIKVLDYTIRNDNQNRGNTFIGADYVTKQEFDELSRQIDLLKEKMEGMKNESNLQSAKRSKQQSINE